jgi:ABC-2 type transport system permease protein
MNGTAFLALLARDVHVARRNLVSLLFQTFLQPLLFVFIFGRVMVGSGYLPPAYKSLLLPGIMAISMVFTGIWAVAMPLIAEFQFTREIEDRLLAPIDISWVAIEKVLRPDSGDRGWPDRDSIGVDHFASWTGT